MKDNKIRKEIEAYKNVKTLKQWICFRLAWAGFGDKVRLCGMAVYFMLGIFLCLLGRLDTGLALMGLALCVLIVHEAMEKYVLETIIERQEKDS